MPETGPPGLQALLDGLDGLTRLDGGGTRHRPNQSVMVAGPAFPG